MGNAETKLVDAVRCGDLGDVRKLVMKGVNIDAKDHIGWTPLMHSAWEGHLDVVRFLEEQGAALEAADKNGITPLILSAEGGHLDVVRFLLDRGAKLNAADNFGRTPLMKSAVQGHLDVVRYLVERSATLDAADNDGSTALMYSAWKGHLNVVRFLLDQDAKLNAADNFGRTPLMKSAVRGHLDVVKLLVERDAAVNVTDKYGKTPLMVCAVQGHMNVVRSLIEQGANVATADGDGDTPLIYLLRSFVNEDELIPVIIQMLSNGASSTYRNKKGESPVTIARDNGYRQLEQLLHAGSRAVLSSESNIGDTHEARQLADKVVSGVAWSRNASFTSLDGKIAHAIPAMSSPPVSYLATDNDGLNDDSLVAMLKHVADHRNLMNEATPLYQHMLFRLQTFAAAVNGMDPGNETLAATVTEIHAISTRLKSLLVANVNKPIVYRLVSVRSVVETLVSLHTDLDQLETICSGRERHEWSSQWEEQVALVRQSIVVHTESNLPTLIDELSSDDLQVEAMTLLMFELSRYMRNYSRQELELMQLVHSRIVGYSKLQVMDVKSWFIPRHEVEIDLGNSVGRGSFGVVYRGVWRKSEVVVKCTTSNSEAEKHAFFREVAVWHRIRHRNIVPFLGACHLSSPYFMVCEYAPGGSLPEYLYRQRQNGKILVWRKLHEVAVGLFYLHEEGIVHGDLKGDNILVAKDGTAMLTDFGLSFVQSATVATLDKWGAIRWRAPEYVVQGGAGPSFAADVYSLAMVIVESVTGQAPWGFMLDIAVTMCLRKKEMLRRPTDCAEMTDEAWDLVSRMSVYEPSKRMLLSDVVDRLQEFADDEEDREWQRTRVKSAFAY